MKRLPLGVTVNAGLPSPDERRWNKVCGLPRRGVPFSTAKSTAQHDVAGFQVAVDDATAVGFFEAFANLDPAPERLLRRERAFLQGVGQGFSFQVLHDQKVAAVLVADVVEGADVGMIQRGDGPRFPIEPLPGFWALRQVGRKNFDGYCALQARVPGAVHLTHPPAPSVATISYGPSLVPWARVIGALESR